MQAFEAARYAGIACGMKNTGIGNGVTERGLAVLRVEPVAVPQKGDKRFKHDDWQEHALFDYIKQSYLIAARWLQKAVADVEGLTPDSQKKVAFFTRQYIDALAPSNFALTNPEVYRETIATGGQNLVKGLHNLLDDIEPARARHLDHLVIEIEPARRHTPRAQHLEELPPPGSDFQHVRAAVETGQIPFQLRADLQRSS